MNKFKKSLKRAGTKVVLAAAAAGTSIAASAADYTTEITAAGTEAEANVSGATLAVIGVAVIGFGVAAVVGWIRR